MGRTLVANKLLAGSACGKRQRGRPLNSVVRLHENHIVVREVVLGRTNVMGHLPRGHRRGCRWFRGLDVGGEWKRFFGGCCRASVPCRGYASSAPSSRISGSAIVRAQGLGAGAIMQPNNALERTEVQRGPRLAAARSSWSAAQRER